MNMKNETGNNDMAKVSAAKQRAIDKYNKAHYISVAFRVSKHLDDDVLDYLAGISNKRAYFLDLIRKDMAARSGNEKVTVMAQFDTGEQFGESIYEFSGTENAISDIVLNLYHGLPEFIQEQISVLNVAAETNDEGVDIIELDMGYGEE